MAALKRAPLAQAQQGLLVRMARSLDGLMVLFDALLDVSQVDAGAVPPTVARRCTPGWQFRRSAGPLAPAAVGPTQGQQPILDLAPTTVSTQDEVAGLSLLSCDATLRSKLSVNAPIGLAPPLDP